MSFSMSPFPLRFGSRQGGGGFTPHFWVDSNAESDGDGSEASPFNLLASAISAVDSQGNGAKLAVVTDSHFYGPQLAFNAALTDVEVRAVGAGARPIFDGSRIISAGAITAHASYANVYQVDVTHETETSTTTANDALTFHIALYEDETLLTERFASGTIDTNVQTVRDNAGSYTAHKIGSTAADPRADSAGTQYRYYFHLTDSGDPRSNGAVMAYAEQDHVALLGNDHVWDGLEFRRSALKDMTGMANAVSFAGGGTVNNCLFRDPGCHGGVLRPARYTNNFAYGRQDGRSKLVGGGGNVFFFNHSLDTYTPPITIENNHVEDFATGYYSHGNLYDGPVHDAIIANNNRAENCTTAWNIDRAKNSMTVNGLVSIGCQKGIVTPAGYAVPEFSGITYLSPSSGDSYGILLNNDAVVSSSSFVFVTAGARRFAINNYADENNTADVFDLTLNNVSNKGGKSPSNARRSQINLTATDSVVGNLAITTGESYSLTSIVGDNSYLSERQNTAAELISAGASLTDCLSPWQMETIDVVPGESDIRQLDSSRTMTEVDSPSLTVTANFSSLPVDAAVRVLDYDGAGSNYDTFLEVSLAPSTSNGGYEVAHTTPANFASKATYYSTYNKTMSFGAPIRDYHSTRTTDGPSFVVDYGAGTHVGQQGSSLWRLTTLTGRTAVAYDIASGSFPQIVSATGLIDAAFYCRVGDTISVTACVNREDDDVIWAGDPDTTGIAILDPSSPLYALGMGRQSA